MKLKIRRWYTFIEDVLSEAGNEPETPLRKAAAVAIVENPYVDRYVEDLTPMIEGSVELGREVARRAVEALGPYQAQSYGKGGIVGLGGEIDHAAALLTSDFANPLRDAVGGGKAWFSSFMKRGAPGTSVDIPLASKDALYIRSHYDGMTIKLHDGPRHDEIAIILAVANRGRINARVGGLQLKDIKGQDGLV
jgi:hypothetical protein